MRHLAYAIAAALSVLIPAAAAASPTPRDMLPQQSIYLHATAATDPPTGSPTSR
ncbi:hypothetical protein ABIA32_005788 [Streptacidiphilus sp. MAP12-20]|uniref:hypothetical protein n=1 Tax=Streptacidiphilus sp. MAP12-20 TaxID=3156299 RepID=UPI00351555B0